jgi:hypothetical protein
MVGLKFVAQGHENITSLISGDRYGILEADVLK